MILKKHFNSQILNQIPKDINVDVLILRIKTDSDVSLEEYFVISSAIEERVSEDINIWYGNGITDESNYLCIEAVMKSEKSTYININKTTKDVLYE